MFAAGKTAGVSAGGGTPDPQFNYVTMLLHGDGTNGAQNNTFLDSSTNNSTITRNGNTTQGSFSPYGSNWSNFFNGAADPNTDRLRITNTSALNLGSGDFTVECWWFSSKALNAYAVEFAHLFGKGNAIVSGTWALGIYQSKIYFATSGVGLQGSTNLTAKSWNHFAATRSGTTVRVFVNGVLDGSTTSSQDITSSATFNIGDRQPSDPSANYPFNGYISNVRVVVGSALYTSNFTPSTTPLTAVSGTVLLTCADNRFVDDSTNNYAITVEGTPSVQRFNPFGTATAYSTSVIGGSGYFDGSGDYLSVPNPQSFAPGTGDWTVECWLYPISGNWAIISGSNFYINNNGGTVYVGDASVDIISVSPPTTNTWTHIATTKSGSTVRLFYNGTQVGSSTTTMSTSTTTSMVVGGRVSAGISLNGYMGGFRMVVGTAVYTSAFTPPSSPPTAITNTSLLLNYTNGAIFDNAMMNDLETVGDAQISTSVFKYGTGSLSFDGSGDYLSTRSTPNLAFGRENFTIEAWVYANSTGSFNGVFSQWPDNNATVNNSYVLESVGSNMQFYWAVGTTLGGPATLGTITTGVWIHYAICRSGNTLYPFKDGVLGTTVSITDTLNNPTSNVTVGGLVAGGGYWNGYIDDLRITKGYARYTANFTPPTQAFPNNGPY